MRRRESADRAHVVQAVGELDQDHPQIAGHRQQHLAEALGHRLVAIAKAELVEFGDAVDQFGHGLAEFARNRLTAELGVLERVVQDRRAQGFDVHAEFGEDARHRQRMGDIGLAALAGLAVMGDRANVIGTLDRGNLLSRQVGAQLDQEGLDGLRTRIEGRVSAG
jgi:hypothetical protein